MTRESAVAALRGVPSGLVVGVSWVPPTALSGLVRTMELDFAFVLAEQPDASGDVSELHALDAAAVWTVSGVFGRVAELLGWTEALRLTAGEPGALAALLAEALHAALESVRVGIDAGADVVLLADDLAGASGPLLSPDYVLDALMPCYRSVAAEVLDSGVPAAFHSDGDVRVLMPALARAGYSAVHLAGLAPDAMAPSIETAQACGLVPVGGLPAALLGADPDGVGRQAGRLARRSGMVVCDDGGLSTAAEIAAYQLAVASARAAFGAE